MSIVKKQPRKKGLKRKRAIGTDRFSRYEDKIRRRYGGKTNSGSTMAIRQLVCPDRMFVKLMYVDVDTPTLSSGGTPTNIYYNQYYANSLWDVNTVVGSTVVPGFSEWAKFYNRYRVYAYKVKYECVNNQTAAPVYMWLHCQPDAQPGSFTLWKNIRDFEANRYSAVKLLSESNAMNRDTVEIFVDLRKFFGNPLMWEADLTFSGFTGGADTGSTPARQTKVYAGVASHDGGSFAASTLLASVNLTITFYAELFDRIDLTS